MSQINVTPLVDVMLVLVVIFILAAPLLASSIRLDLPTAEGAEPGAPPQAVELSLDAAGQLFWADEPMAAAVLPQRLRALAARAPETEIQLRADARVPYGRVAEVLGAASAAGLGRIGFVAQPPAGVQNQEQPVSAKQ